MMTQEEYMDLLAMRRQGNTISEIAEKLGYHPETISKWFRDGGPPPSRTIAPAERVIDVRWAERIRQLIAPPAEKLLASSAIEKRLGLRLPSDSKSFVTAYRLGPLNEHTYVLCRCRV